MQKITLAEFNDINVVALLDRTDRWLRVVGKRSAIPFEIKRGSCFVFENDTLPRMAFTEFRDAGARVLPSRGVTVLTVDFEDTFLVRLAE